MYFMIKTQFLHRLSYISWNISEFYVFILEACPECPATPATHATPNFDQKWYNFKTTWDANVAKGFEDVPRTKDDAISKNWREVSNDCSENAE